MSSLHLFIFRFHKYIIILCGILTLFAAILTTQLKLDLNLLSLLPSDDPSVKTFFEISEDFGVQSVLVAVIEVPPDFSRSKSESFVDILVKNLRKSTLINEINYKSSERDLSLLFQTYMEYFPVFLRTRELNELAQKLSDSEIQRQVRENKKLLMTPFSIVSKELIYNDPLGLRKLIRTNQSFSGQLKVKLLMKSENSFSGLYNMPLKIGRRDLRSRSLVFSFMRKCTSITICFSRFPKRLSIWEF